MMEMIKNPILRGFHPDPSIIRVGEDYYIATSTFEWWPGIRLHHSRDLIHWDLIGYPLNRTSQLDLRGVGPSQGVWAPCLTYDKGVFYLVYSVVKAYYCNMYDTENYLVTTRDICGPWSEPVPLNNFGFDPSLFHDEDGRKYMVCMVTDHRIPKKYAGRLVLQEFDAAQGKMVGPVKDIYRGERIFLEGPHIFKRNGLYYLFCADSGTGEAHGQSILRSDCVWGPYEMYRPENPERKEWEAYSILTSRHREDILLQKAGHCDLVETQDGEWYAVCLCGRVSGRRNPPDAPRFPGARRYMLGRETAIQKMVWTADGWPVLMQGGNTPSDETEAPGFLREEAESGAPGFLTEKAGSEVPGFLRGETGTEVSETLTKRGEAPFTRDDFDGRELSLEYQSPRIPMDGHYLSLGERPGWLRMYGRSGLASRFSQSMIARRLTEYRMDAETCLDFEPEVFKQMAGLILLYDTDNYLYLHVTRDEDVGKCLALLKAENKKYEYLAAEIALEPNRDVILRMSLRGADVTFSYGYRPEKEGREAEFVQAGPSVDASFLSDEACVEGWFTGTMIGLCCQDLTGFGKYADFDWFTVE